MRRTNSNPVRGRLFVISSPSGGGKTTLAKRLFRVKGLGLMRSVSVTTRKPRKGERDGIDYHFISGAAFSGMVRKRQLLEWEMNFGHWYGTPKRFVRDTLRAGESLLLSIDVRGAIRLKKMYPRRSVLIFLKPPSVRSLKERLERRRTDESPDISRRLREAGRELSYRKYFDHIVLNDCLESAFVRLRRIISRELGKNNR